MILKSSQISQENPLCWSLYFEEYLWATASVFFVVVVVFHLQTKSLTGIFIRALLFRFQCVKSVSIRSFSGPYFLAFRLNRNWYRVSFRILLKRRKIRTRKTSNTGLFRLCSGFRFCLLFPFGYKVTLKMSYVWWKQIVRKYFFIKKGIQRCKHPVRNLGWSAFFKKIDNFCLFS